MTTSQENSASITLLQDLANKRYSKIAITSKSFSVLSILKKVILEQLVAASKPQRCIWLDSEHSPKDTLYWLRDTCPSLVSGTVIIDLFTDPLGIFQNNKNTNPNIILATLNGIKENLESVAKQERTLVIIENYNTVVRRKGWHFLRTLMDTYWKTGEGRSITYVLLGYPEHDEHCLHALVHLVLSGNQWEVVDNMIKCKIDSVRHLLSGNIRMEHFQLTCSKIDPRSKEIPSKTHLEKIDSSKKVTPRETEDLSKIFGDLTFKVALSEAEKNIRAQVELPYVHKDVSLANTALEEHPRGLLFPSSDEDPEQDSDEDLDV